MSKLPLKKIKQDDLFLDVFSPFSKTYKSNNACSAPATAPIAVHVSKE